jgi:hypothetical protein
MPAEIHRVIAERLCDGGLSEANGSRHRDSRNRSCAVDQDVPRIGVVQITGEKFYRVPRDAGSIIHILANGRSLQRERTEDLSTNSGRNSPARTSRHEVVVIGCDRCHVVRASRIDVTADAAGEKPRYNVRRRGSLIIAARPAIAGVKARRRAIADPDNLGVAGSGFNCSNSGRPFWQARDVEGIARSPKKWPTRPPQRTPCAH